MSSRECSLLCASQAADFSQRSSLLAAWGLRCSAWARMQTNAWTLLARLLQSGIDTATVLCGTQRITLLRSQEKVSFSQTLIRGLHCFCKAAASATNNKGAPVCAERALCDLAP